MKRSDKLSNSPQMVQTEIWYYEERGGIDVYIGAEYFRDIKPDTCLSFRIPRKKLSNSLKRIEASRKVRR